MNDFQMVGKIKKISKKGKSLYVVLKPLSGKSSVWNCFTTQFDNVGKVGDVIEVTNYEPVNISFNTHNDTKFFQGIEIYDFKKINKDEIDRKDWKKENFEDTDDDEVEEDLVDLDFDF